MTTKTSDIIRITELIAISKGIKAIQIANRLGLTRKAVNQFLYPFNDICFVKDSNHFWHIKEGSQEKNLLADKHDVRPLIFVPPVTSISAN